MAKKPMPVCDDDREEEPITASELARSEEREVQAKNPVHLIEVHDGKFKHINGCQPQDFFDAHLLAETRANSHRRTMEFLMAASEYYKRLSAIQ